MKDRYSIRIFDPKHHASLETTKQVCSGVADVMDNFPTIKNDVIDCIEMTNTNLGMNELGKTVTLSYRNGTTVSTIMIDTSKEFNHDSQGAYHTGAHEATHAIHARLLRLYKNDLESRYYQVECDMNDAEYEVDLLNEQVSHAMNRAEYEEAAHNLNEYMATEYLPTQKQYKALSTEYKRITKAKDNGSLAFSGTLKKNALRLYNKKLKQEGL